MIERWHSLAPRERRIIGLGGAAALVLLVLGVVLPLNGSVSRAHSRLEQKAQDLAWMRSVAPELASAGPVSAAPSGQSLVVVIDRAAREAGLSKALVSTEPSGADGLRLRFEKASFDLLVGLIARVAEQHGARVESASVDSSGEPGIVNASVVLRVR
ncbi:MAG TPA: type II secretion system protein GspM [Steroidobacteraceae bacterium]|nr:type II secretion system protein GspM [Steroidobacteraceae bacterium]